MNPCLGYLASAGIRRFRPGFKPDPNDTQCRHACDRQIWGGVCACMHGFLTQACSACVLFSQCACFCCPGGAVVASGGMGADLFFAQVTRQGCQ